MTQTTQRDGPGPSLTFGLALPNYRAGASPEGIAAAAETCRRLGWESIWTTDHVLPDTSPRAAEYAHLYEALVTLAWLASAFPELRLGTSVIVVPMRNAAVLAKELATIDALSGGRLIVGVGVGWNETEFRNIGLGDRFRVRGRYLDEAIELWRHLWSGSTEPFHGRFHDFDDFAAHPLPSQGASLPIWVGGRSEAAYRRAGRLGDAYHSSAAGPSDLADRVPKVLAAAREAGRAEPMISSRVRVRPEDDGRSGYVMSGTAAEMLAEVDAFAAAGVRHLVVDFMETEPERHTRLLERFHADVASTRMATS
jgi:probable F420-dependent oxidoreductase